MFIKIAWLISQLFVLTGKPCVASWYGESWNGRLTASGTVYDCSEFTCAHKTLPLGTVIRFWNPQGVWLDSRITDRGPYVRGRDFDLSTTCFDSLGNLNEGVIQLQYRIIGRDITGLHYNLNLPDEASCERERVVSNDRWITARVSCDYRWIR